MSPLPALLDWYSPNFKLLRVWRKCFPRVKLAGNLNECSWILWTFGFQTDVTDCNETLNPAWWSAQALTRKRHTAFPVQKQPQEPRGPDGEHSTWGLPFGRGHSQKHNLYISEAVFVGKYRHISDPSKSGVGLMNLIGHSIALQLHCGWAAFTACAACGDYVGLLTVGCDVERMLCLLLQDATHKTLLQLWLNGRLCFFFLLTSCWVWIHWMFTDYWSEKWDWCGWSKEQRCRVEMFG